MKIENICEGVNFLYHTYYNSGKGVFHVFWHKIAIFKKTIFQEHLSTTASGTPSK